MTLFNFILLSMLSTFVGFIGLTFVLVCVVLVLDLISLIMDKIDTIYKKQDYQGNEDTNE